jgi:hypothetical protein
MRDSRNDAVASARMTGVAASDMRDDTIDVERTKEARGAIRQARTLLVASVLATLVSVAPASSGQTVAPTLEVTATGRTDGHATLVWTSAGDEAKSPEFELQSSTSAGFSPSLRCYLGPDRASFRSGLTEGLHHFRVRERSGDGGAWGPWSEAVTVEIRPYALRTAWTLFGVGALLVASILGYLVTANARARRVGRGT